MTDAEIRSAFEAFSRGEISRPDLGRCIGEDLSFGETLRRLRMFGLPLPRFQSDRNSPGVRLVRDLASRRPRGG